MRPLRIAALLAVVVLAAVAAAWWWSLPDAPGAFFDMPSGTPAAPGTLLRSEPFDRALPPGTRGWRILYATTRDGGAAALASALVVVPDLLPPEPRPVIAWTHGTTGVAPGCGPSLLAEPFANVPGLAALAAQGWAFVATDYAGMTAPGAGGYLVGESEGRSALDAVRAARALPGVALDRRTVVWGHSQGGHAALWTAMLAPRYAPEVDVVGVAAAAPASLPAPLMRAAQGTLVGKIMTSYVLTAYEATYPDVSLDAATRPVARPLVRDMARRCLAGKQALVSVIEARLLPDAILAADPATGALGRRLDANVPRGTIAPPVLIAQGLADELVLPAVQDAYVAERCAAGQAIDYRRYAGRDHLSLVAADSPFDAELVQWTRDRFAGAPVDTGCRIAAR